MRLEGQTNAIQEEFLATGNALPVQKALTVARDESVIQAYLAAIEKLFPHSVALLAGGAFGRGHTFPYSELDIVLLLDSARQSNAVNEILPEFVRLLWNRGLRPQPTVLTLAECVAAVDQGSVASFSLLDRRLLAGDSTVMKRLDDTLPAVMATHGEIMRQQLCELAGARHTRYENTAYHAQPDVKEGPGGLQDVRLIDWLAMLKAQHEPRSEELNQAVATVSSVRCFLHYTAGCDHNVLDRDALESLARQAFARDRPASYWTREYFRCARAIFNEARRAIEGAERSQSSLLLNFREYRSRLSNQEFTVLRERLLLRSPAHLASDPALVFRMLEFIGRHGVAPAWETERRLEAAQEPFAAHCVQQPIWAVLKATLAAPNAAMALRTLQATGLLHQMLAGWSEIEHVVTKGSEHRYTLDEHTLRTIEALLPLRTANGPGQQRFASLLSEIDDAAVLVFALLFVEMERAVERGREAAERMRMPEDDRATVEFLIEHRADLSEAVSGSDLHDPAMVRLLAERVGTIERLRLLSVMTYAQTVALTGEERIHARLEQLWQAYSAIQHELIRELETDRIEQIPENLAADALFVKGFPLRYLRAHTAAEITLHLRLFELSRPTGVAVKLESTGGVYRLTVVARDRPFLFASFAGAITSFELDILKAEAFANSSGVVLDTFVLADPKRILRLNPAEADRLTDLMQRTALGKTDAHQLVKSKNVPDPHKRATPPQIVFDSDACPTATLVEINAEDRPGLLYGLATVFSSNACNIDVVLVDTKGHRAIDVFYVAHDGEKLTLDMQERLREKLRAVC